MGAPQPRTTAASMDGTFPTAAAPTIEPPHIVTIEELIASREAVLAKQAADKVLMSAIANPTQEVFRGPLFQWAATGFERGFMIYSVEITPPALCDDGVGRSIGNYIEYCTGQTIETLCATIQSMMNGIQVFHSFLGSAVRLHVNKL